GRGNDHTEFTEQSSNESLQEENWQENDRQRYGRRDNREKYFLRSVQRRLVFVHALFELLVNVLGYHYPVVHYKTSSQYYTQHGENIDGEVAHVHNEKRGDERDRNIDERPDRDPPVTEEKVNNQDNENDRDEQRFFHLTDGTLDEHRLVHRDVKLDVFRNFLLYLFHPLVKLIRDGNEVG